MSADLERALLSLAMTGADITTASRTIEAGDFYFPAHGSLWTSIVDVVQAGQIVTPETVRDALAKVAPAQLANPTLIIDILASTPLAGDVDWYAGRISDAAERRGLIDAALRIKQFAESESLEMPQIRDRARDALDDALAGRTTSNLVRMSDVFQDVIDQAEKGQSPALSTPWPDLDRLIGGLAPGRLVTIGARPAVGKSLAGTNLALHFAGHHKHAVLIASMEMNREEVVQRMVAADCKVDLTRLTNGTLTEAEWRAINDRFNEIDAMPVYVQDDGAMTVTAIRSWAREIQRDRSDLALIVVDYIQLMDTASRTNNRVEALGQISRGLKQLARETNTCVVAMAQTNRESLKHGGDGRPKMSDLRESGSIEADSNVVILMHRPDDDLPEVELIVDKNRHGIKGIATLGVQGHYARLTSTAWTPSRSVS